MEVSLTRRLPFSSLLPLAAIWARLVSRLLAISLTLNKSPCAIPAVNPTSSSSAPTTIYLPWGGGWGLGVDLHVPVIRGRSPGLDQMLRNGVSILEDHGFPT